MSVPRYPKYKGSGVDWFGEVPEHWSLVPLRAVVAHIDRRNDQLCQDYLSLMANVGVIPYETKGDVGNKKPEDLSKCKLVRAGDIVINSMNFGIGSYGLSPYDGVCSPVYVILRAYEDSAIRRFVFASLKVAHSKSTLHHLATGSWLIVRQSVGMTSRQ